MIENSSASEEWARKGRKRKGNRYRETEKTNAIVRAKLCVCETRVYASPLARAVVHMGLACPPAIAMA